MGIYSDEGWCGLKGIVLIIIGFLMFCVLVLVNSVVSFCWKGLLGEFLFIVGLLKWVKYFDVVKLWYGDIKKKWLGVSVVMVCCIFLVSDVFILFFIKW